jgi:hypothetical protein
MSAKSGAEKRPWHWQRESLGIRRDEWLITAIRRVFAKITDRVGRWRFAWDSPGITPNEQQPQGVVPKGLLVSEGGLEPPQELSHMALNPIPASEGVPCVLRGAVATTVSVHTVRRVPVPPKGYRPPFVRTRNLPDRSVLIDKRPPAKVNGLVPDRIHGVGTYPAPVTQRDAPTAL